MRFSATGCLVCLDLVIDLLEKGISGIAIGDVQSLGEQLLALGLGLHRTHEGIHQGGMKMHHEGEANGIVHGSLHRRATVLGYACRGQVFLHLGLALGSVGTVSLGAHRVQLGAVQNGKSVFANGGEGVAAGFYPQLVCSLERSVAATGNHEPGIRPIPAGYFNQLFNFFHILSSGG